MCGWGSSHSISIICISVFQKHLLPLKNVFTELGFENSWERPPFTGLPGGLAILGSFPRKGSGVPAPRLSQFCRLLRHSSPGCRELRKQGCLVKVFLLLRKQGCLVKVFMYPRADRSSGTSHVHAWMAWKVNTPCLGKQDTVFSATVSLELWGMGLKNTEGTSTLLLCPHAQFEQL